MEEYNETEGNGASCVADFVVLIGIGLTAFLLFMSFGLFAFGHAFQDEFRPPPIPPPLLQTIGSTIIYIYFPSLPTFFAYWFYFNVHSVDYYEQRRAWLAAFKVSLMPCLINLAIWLYWFCRDTFTEPRY